MNKTNKNLASGEKPTKPVTSSLRDRVLFLSAAGGTILGGNMIKAREPVRCGMTGIEIPPEDAGLCNNAYGCQNCEHYDEDAEIEVLINFGKVAFTIIAAIILILVGMTIVKAEEIPDEEAVLCIIGEAEGEGEIGMEAVAEAIRNRGSLKGVYGCSAPRVRKHLYSDRILLQAKRAWKKSAGDGDITFGARFWEGTAFKTPYWAKDMVVTATIGRQRFYKEVSNAKR